MWFGFSVWLVVMCGWRDGGRVGLGGGGDLAVGSVGPVGVCLMVLVFLVVGVPRKVDRWVSALV